jgi:hypothetical protein
MSKSSEPKPKKSDKKKAEKKPKRVTGQNVGPQGFLAEHGEKLGFGLFAAVVVLCLWGAMGHDSYTKTPAELASTLQQRRQAVDQNNPETFAPLKDIRGEEYEKKAELSVAPVSLVDRLPVPGVYDPYRPPTQKRGTPEMYPAEQPAAYPLSMAVPWEKGEAKKPGKVAPKGPPGAKAAGPAGAMALLGAGPAAAPAMAAMGRRAAKGAQVPPDAPHRGVQCVMITFRVPRVKQAEAFRRVFEAARDYQPSRDRAQYVSFWIERKTDGGDWASSVTVDTPSGPQQMSLTEAFWRTQEYFGNFRFPEIVDTLQEDCVVPFMMVEGPEGKGPIYSGFTVSPLPPILGEDFDDRAAGGFPVKQAAGPQGVPGPGAPGVGLPAGPAGGLPAEPAGGLPGAPGAIGQPGQVPPPAGITRGQKRPGKAKPGGAKWAGPGRMVGGRPAGEAAGPNFTDPGGGRMVGGRPVGEAGGGPNFTEPPGGRMVGGRPAGEGMGPNPGVGNGGVRNPWMNNQPAPNRNVGVGVNQVQVEQLSDILLRFFDFTVEEGHTYQYRVSISLKNPNHKLAPGLLKDIKANEAEFLVTPFSEPTEPVRVTVGGGEVIAGWVKPARIESGIADSATAILRQRYRSTGAVVSHTFNRLEAGQVLNLPVKDVVEIKFETPVGGIDSLSKETLNKFEFRSDNLLLDLRGTGEKGWPGELLLLDASGRLVVQRELGPANPAFAEENKRLEEIYNRQTAPPAEAAGAFNGFDGIVDPLGLPTPNPKKKR